MMKFGGDEEQPSNSEYALRINMSENEGKYMMRAEEFINIACNSGYATKKNAKKLRAYRIPTPRFIEKRASGSGCYQNPQL